MPMSCGATNWYIDTLTYYLNTCHRKCGSPNRCYLFSVTLLSDTKKAVKNAILAAFYL